ncbi:hypothetical protein ACIA49_04065 [Kribbella sp. NPDC051587]|uniref:hypothetical protein n=1 Tax=Kribbella sp. NPDC051587 TaxID=3364119 RepID=UPI003799C9EB
MIEPASESEPQRPQEHGPNEPAPIQHMAVQSVHSVGESNATDPAADEIAAGEAVPDLVDSEPLRSVYMSADSDAVSLRELVSDAHVAEEHVVLAVAVDALLEASDSHGVPSDASSDSSVLKPLDDAGSAAAASEPDSEPDGVSLRFEQRSSGSGPAFQANVMHVSYGTGEYVKLSRVSSVELSFALSDDFVGPFQRQTDGTVPEDTQFEVAETLLAEHGMVVLVASAGTGRRTLALRLLGRANGAEVVPDVHDLEPQWKAPDTDALPADNGRFILDLTDSTADELTAVFCKKLVAYGTEQKDQGRRVVVLLTPQEQVRSAEEPLRRFMLSVSPPDARRLVEGLVRRERPDRLADLGSGVYDNIFASQPGASELVRLAQLISTAGDRSPAEIRDEYQGWSEHIASLLTVTHDPTWQGGVLEARAMIWAGALLNGCQLRSVVRAADDLLQRLGKSRRPADILGGPTARQRLKAGGLQESDSVVAHDRTKHGLPEAILRNMLETFHTKGDVLTKWAVAVAADKDASESEAQGAATALFDLAVSHRHVEIIRELGSELAGSRLSLAVDKLTEAALAPESGIFTRNLLYRWATSTSEDQRQLVIAVCGGRLGVEKPDIALTRLWWTAELTAKPDKTLVGAFSSLVTYQPMVTLEALKAWFKAKGEDPKTLGVVIAIADSDLGARFLVEGLAESAVGAGLRVAWQALLTRTDARGLLSGVVDRWCELVARGDLPEEQVLDFLSDVYAPGIDGSETLFGDGHEFVASFRGRILTRAIEKRVERRLTAES